MAELKARHAYGKSENVAAAIAANKIDAYDILLLDSDTEPKIGWIDAKGNPVIVSNGDDEVISVDTLPEAGESGKIYIYQNEGYVWDAAESKFVAISKSVDVSALEEEVATKVTAEEVKMMIEESGNSFVEIVEF